MIILISEQSIHAMAIYADIIVAYVSEEAVCCVAFNVFSRAVCFDTGAPLMNIMTRGA